MKQSSIFVHIKNILILPFTVTVIIPYLVYKPGKEFLPSGFLFKIPGILLLAAGLTLLIYTIFLFGSIGKGTLAPWDPTQRLVIKGPYAYCRNPMISGVLFILAGESFLFNSSGILYWAGIFFLINNIYFFFIEEPDLYKRFGEDYREYKKQVPRWIPNIKPYNNNHDRR